MKDPFEVWIDQLQHSDRNVRGRAALELGTLGDARAVGALIRALGAESNPFVSDNITRPLACMPEAAVEPLIRMLRDPDPRARFHAAHTFSKIMDPRAVDPLIDRLGDDDIAVVTKAAFALGRIGDERAIPPLAALVSHES